MKKSKFEKTDYLVVEVSDPINEKLIGIKCIPARWAEKVLRYDYSVIRYPEEESFETKLQVKNKEPSNPTWPLYLALIMLVTDSYEKACKVLDFLTEKDIMDVTDTADKPPNKTLENAELSDTPSTSNKRRSLDENEKITLNDDSVPKKKRKSAVRSENNVKMLIQSGQLLSNKQKTSPKKFSALRKENLKETLEALISAEKIDKLFSKAVTSKSHEIVEIISSSDDSDTDSANEGEPETLCTPEISVLEAILKDMPYKTATPTKEQNTIQTDKTPEKSKTPVHETAVTDSSQISSRNHLEQQKEPKTNTDEGQSSLTADISTLGDQIRNLTPTNSENGIKNNSEEDIKHLEDIYNSIIGAKSNFNAVFVEKSEEFRKAFKYLNLNVPELKQGLSLPSIQQLRENRLRTTEEPQPSTSRQEQPTQRKANSSRSRTLSPH